MSELKLKRLLSKRSLTSEDEDRAVELFDKYEAETLPYFVDLDVEQDEKSWKSGMKEVINTLELSKNQTFNLVKAFGPPDASQKAAGFDLSFPKESSSLIKMQHYIINREGFNYRWFPGYVKKELKHDVIPSIDPFGPKMGKKETRIPMPRGNPIPKKPRPPKKPRVPPLPGYGNPVKPSGRKMAKGRVRKPLPLTPKRKPLPARPKRRKPLPRVPKRLPPIPSDDEYDTAEEEEFETADESSDLMDVDEFHAELDREMNPRKPLPPIPRPDPDIMDVNEFHAKLDREMNPRKKRKSKSKSKGKKKIKGSVKKVSKKMPKKKRSSSAPPKKKAAPKKTVLKVVRKKKRTSTKPKKGGIIVNYGVEGTQVVKRIGRQKERIEPIGDTTKKQLRARRKAGNDKYKNWTLNQFYANGYKKIPWKQIEAHGGKALAGRKIPKKLPVYSTPKAYRDAGRRVPWKKLFPNLSKSEIEKKKRSYNKSGVPKKKKRTTKKK